ncbi:hypothetical protein [Leyella stercorea]|uniref:hypothetical protein n=2 Tax=Prevotellaceae TaxID=171552 RepID=UPI001F4367CD|nr:hypothetical protein [Leyella stercorea]MCF2646117.1 hypothetical protein [Leyella stercorea]
MDGPESEPFADVAPYIFEDLGRAYAVVKKQYRNTDLKNMLSDSTSSKYIP